MTRTTFAAILAALMTFAAGAVLLASTAAADINAPINPAGCDATVLPGVDEDDGRLASVGFDLNIGGGETVNEVFISENGVVTLDADIEIEDWVSATSLQSLSTGWFGSDTELIAPLYADATRSDGGSVNWGTTSYAGRAAFCVQWNGLTPFIPDGVDPLPAPLPENTFELVLVERGDRAAGDFDIIVNYESIEWDETYCLQLGGPIDVDFDFEPVDRGFGGNDGCAQVCDAEPQERGLPEECCVLFENCCEFAVGERGNLNECCPNQFQRGLDCLVARDGQRNIFAPGESAGALAGVAFPLTFGTGGIIEFPGSGQVGEMIDDADTGGLAAQSLNSIQPGRYIIEVTDGFQADLGTITGSVTGEGTALADAPLSICTTASPRQCVATVTDPDGGYEAAGLPLGEYEINARSPGGAANYNPGSTTVVIVTAGIDTVAPTIDLLLPRVPPGGVNFGPTLGWGSGTTIHWRATLNLSAGGCPGGVATWTITASQGTPNTRSGPMAEGPAGTYSASVPPVYPTHGSGAVTIAIDCPDPTPDEEIEFDLYIDPSGTVLEADSNEPIPGATTVLSRSELEVGPFVDVPDGDKIMSPSNRVNPFVVDDDGLFGWDVIEGYYLVTATAPDCHAVGDPNTAEVITDVLPVYPEWLGLELFLDCNNPPTIATAGDVTAEAPADSTLLIAPAVADLDAGDVPQLVVTNDAPAQFPLGDTVVTWTVTDPDGEQATSTQTVTVVDTTPPAFGAAPDIQVSTPDTAGRTATFTVTATDLVDGAVTVTCAPASGSNFPIGTTEVTCSAEDAAGNPSSVTFDVEVLLGPDVVDPIVTAPADMSIQTNDAAGATATFTATATDDRDGTLTPTCTPASGSLFALGDTEVTCEVTDAAGNTGSATFTVSVFLGPDTVDPVVAALSDIEVDADDAMGTNVTYTATATDDRDGDLTATCVPASGALFPIGDTEVTCTATDAAGNTDSATFTVTVNDLPVTPTPPKPKPKPDPEPEPEPPAPSGPVLKCRGEVVTVNLGAGESPTNGDDVILGTAGPDVIDGLAGDDVICGLGAADVIQGGPGDDVLWGGWGHDKLRGGPGDDKLWGMRGNDRLFGQKGDDRLFGRVGADILWGGLGNDRLWGGPGKDRLSTGAGDDLAGGGAQADTLTGAKGDDTLMGGDGNDTLMGLTGDDMLKGEGGDDILNGGEGTDTCIGGEGNDTIDPACEA